MAIRKYFRRAERRQTPRIKAADLVAYYWTGGVPSPRRVRDIGLDGAYIVAPDVFYPGTLIQIVFAEKAAGDCGDGMPHTCVHGRALRRGPDGFGVAFLFQGRQERRKLRHFLADLKREPEGAFEAGANADECPSTESKANSAEQVDQEQPSG